MAKKFEVTFNDLTGNSSVHSEPSIDSSESASFNSTSATRLNFGMYVDTPPTGSAMGMVGTPQMMHMPWIDPHRVDPTNPWKVEPMPYKPVEYDYESIQRQIVESLQVTSVSNVRKAIVETDSDYHIKVELPGFDHSDVKVVRKNSEISIQLTHGDQAFEDDQYLENSLTDIRDDIVFEIPCDFNPVPNRLRFRNGVLLMSFSRMVESEELSVEDAEPDILRDAVNEMKEEK